MPASVVRRLVAELQRPVECRPLIVSELDPELVGLLGLEMGLLIERGISYPDREDEKRAAQRLAAPHDSSP